MRKPISNAWEANSALLRKSCAQVGTSVVASQLPMSGERCSDGSHHRKASGSHPGKISQQPLDRKSKERIPPIHVRFKTREQADYVKAKAAEAKLSVNSYICSAALDHLYVSPYDPVTINELRLVKRHLTGIGINLNQLTHRLNAGSIHVDPVLDYIDIVRDPVLEAIGLIRKALARGANTSPGQQ